MLILYCINVVSEKIYHVFVWLADPVGKPIQLNPVVEPFQLDPVGEPIHLASSWIQLAQWPSKQGNPITLGVEHKPVQY